MADALLLRFAQEELTYLLRAVGIERLPGVHTDLPAEWDTSQKALALAVADRTLRARQVVQWKGLEQRHVDAVVAGMLRTCAGARYSLLLEMRQGERPELRYLYALAENAAIEHCIPEPGIHEFTCMATAPDLARRLAGLLGLQQARTGQGTSGVIGRERFREARAIGASDAGAAARLLAAELPWDTAERLAAALHQPAAWAHLALWEGAPDQSENPVPREALTLLQGDSGLYVLQSAPASTEHWQVTSSLPAQAQEAMDRMLAPALSVLPAASGEAHRRSRP